MPVANNFNQRKKRRKKKIGKLGFDGVIQMSSQGKFGYSLAEKSLHLVHNVIILVYIFLWRRHNLFLKNYIMRTVINVWNLNGYIK